MKNFQINETLLKRHRDWSDQTFGTRAIKGPIGPLRHMIKEVEECIADPYDISEFGDVMFLFLDSLHRAGYDCEDLNNAMLGKMDVLLSRDYSNKGPSDEPVEHKRD